MSLGMIIFDVDGTLIDDQDQPRWEVIDLLRAFKALGYDIGVWSGGGADYAGRWCERLGIAQFVSWVGTKSHIPIEVTLFVDDKEGADFGVAPVLIV